uniref:Uncharacterized protein n=1 Tax=Peronospora matthiolae TaxID=2874970 RepID=A0AAV1TT07_9STRA
MAMFKRDPQRRPPRSELTSRFNTNRKAFGVGLPVTDMESADSHSCRSNTFDPDHLGVDGVRRPHLATIKAIMIEGFAAQRIRMSAIVDL